MKGYLGIGLASALATIVLIVIGLATIYILSPSDLEACNLNFLDSAGFQLKEKHSVQLQSALLGEKIIAASLYQRRWLILSECIVMIEAPENKFCWMIRSFDSCPSDSFWKDNMTKYVEDWDCLTANCCEIITESFRFY